MKRPKQHIPSSCLPNSLSPKHNKHQHHTTEVNTDNHNPQKVLGVVVGCLGYIRWRDGGGSWGVGGIPLWLGLIDSSVNLVASRLIARLICEETGESPALPCGCWWLEGGLEEISGDFCVLQGYNNNRTDLSVWLSSKTWLRSPGRVLQTLLNHIKSRIIIYNLFLIHWFNRDQVQLKT